MTAVPELFRDGGPLNYGMWLHQEETWPSESARNDRTGHRPVHQPIAEMAPQHAVSALHKLIRWAKESPTGRMVAYDLDSRELEVRTSPLGMALAARALGLDTGEALGLYAIDDPRARAGEPAPVKHLAAEVLVVLAHDSELNLEFHECGTAAMAVAHRVTQRWRVTER